MWYLPEPNKKDLDKYVDDLLERIKRHRKYGVYKDFFEKDKNDNPHDYIKDILGGKPSIIYKLNAELMGRIVGDSYKEEDMKVLTEVNKKITKAKRKGVTPIMDPNERRVVNDYGDKVNDLRKIFNYDWISKDKEFSYSLSNIKHTYTCPYCNRQYTMTIENSSDKTDSRYISRPHFDHWFPQESFPLLSLSFYNLIPSCPICNSTLKGSSVMSLNEYVNPYEQKKGYEPQFKFRVLFKGDRNYELYETKSPDKKEEKMLNDFHLREIYKFHEKLEVGDLVKLKREHSDSYLSKLMSSILKDLGKTYSIRDIIRMVFGAEIDAAHLSDRPLSKLKKDLLVQFHILDEDGKIHPELLQLMKEKKEK